MLVISILSFTYICSWLSDWLIVWCLTPFSTVFQLYQGGQYTYPCFLGFFLTSTSHNILSKPMTAFPHNHCWNNWQQWKRNESCCNDYHQSLERILAKPGIEPVTSRSQGTFIEKCHCMSHMKFVVCKCFQHGSVQNFLVFLRNNLCSAY